MKNKLLILLGIICLVVLAGYIFRGEIFRIFFSPTETSFPQGDISAEIKDPEIVIQNLSIPWELVFLPNGDMLVTERAGKILRIGDDKKVIEIQDVSHRGEGGLLGLALHPNFRSNNFVYIYLTTSTSGRITNRVERYVFKNDNLTDRKIILENIPGSTNHDGGRIAFGPDGFLYITTGDAGSPSSSQDKNSLAGKILRITDEGGIPSDNPFGNPVYSIGIRNSQGIAWDEAGNLWSTDHGRSGARSGFDELNKIIKGGNYGWPEYEGDETNSGIIAPQIHSGSNETWAPAGILVYDNKIIFTGLRGSSLYVADIINGKAENLRVYFRGEYGRIRTAVLGPDNMIYILTNNRDGRGRPISSDDRIIKIDPKALK